MKNIKIMQERINLYNNIRDFFAKRQVLEVETPILSNYGATDVNIDSFITYSDSTKKKSYYLQTSPEFPMKRLLSAGYPDIFQICKVFRREEAGSLHNPEFTMLEWYRIGFSLEQLMAEVADLVKSLSKNFSHLDVEYLEYKDAFSYLGINPLTDSLETIKTKTYELMEYVPKLSDNIDEWLDLLLVSFVEKELGKDKLTFLYHYPSSQAALAKNIKDNDGNIIAKRFELYYQGIELANGFDELTDGCEQELRFIADENQRKLLGKDNIPHDKNLIKSLKSGMPECSGVALGLDRLLMLMLDKSRIDEVLVFPVNKS